jgi:hypothetical protein
MLNSAEVRTEELPAPYEWNGKIIQYAYSNPMSMQPIGAFVKSGSCRDLAIIGIALAQRFLESPLIGVKDPHFQAGQMVLDRIKEWYFDGDLPGAYLWELLDADNEAGNLTMRTMDLDENVAVTWSGFHESILYSIRCAYDRHPDEAMPEPICESDRSALLDAVARAIELKTASEEELERLAARLQDSVGAVDPDGLGPKRSKAEFECLISSPL